MSSLEAIVARVAELDRLVNGRDASRFGLLSVGNQGAAAASGAAIPTSFSSALEAVSVAPPQTAPAAGTAAGSSPAAAAATAATFVSPLPGATLTQAFGPTTLELEPPATIKGVRYAHFHQGIDLARPLGTPVLAAADGTVIAAGRASDGAVIVRIRHADGSETLYGHLQASLKVTAGQKVVAGQQIGQVGLTGNTTGPHLHFALYQKDGTPIDPSIWLTAGRLPGQAAPAATAGQPAAAGGPAATASSNGLLTADGLAHFDAVASSIPYAKQIRAAAVANGVDPLLLASLVGAESSFHTTSVSSAGAMGLTQLMPATAKWLKVTDPFDPAQNLNGGARYLSIQLKNFGRVDLALAAYQAGPTIVRTLHAVPDYPSTHAYIKRILRDWGSYLEQSQ